MRDQAGIHTEAQIQAVQDLVRELVRAMRSLRLYEASHPIVGRILEHLATGWEQATAAGPLTLRLTQREVLLDEEIVYRAAGRVEVVPTVLHDDGIAGIVLSSGVDPDELRRFVTVLASEPDPRTDYPALLWDAELLSVQLLLESDEADGAPLSRADFSTEVAQLSEGDDVEVAPQYEEERRLIAARSAGSDLRTLEDPDLFALTEDQKLHLNHCVQVDHYLETVRHVMRVIHSLAREDLSADDAEPLEFALPGLVEAVADAGDLDGAAEILDRVEHMRSSPHDLEVHVAELTLACFLDDERLRALFRRLDEREEVEARLLGDLFAKLGPSAVHEAAAWLVETKHSEIVGPAMRLFGDDAVYVLTRKYAGADQVPRERIAKALLEIGTEDAMAALSTHFPDLPESARLELLKRLATMPEGAARAPVLYGLRDRSGRVRRTAMNAARRADAPGIATLVEELIESDAFSQWPVDEVDAMFGMLARIGDETIAEVLAAQCVLKGIRRAFVKLTPAQTLYLKTLRRMRDPGARRVAEELKAAAPRAVRDVLDDPLADF